MENKYSGLEIAVVGMACRVPDADNYRAFWANLTEGMESLEELTTEDILRSGVDRRMAASDRYVKVQRQLKNKEFFDYQFFGYNANEAKLLSPQSRLLHECLWEAVEDSGHEIKQIDNAGLFIGLAEDYPWKIHVSTEKERGVVDGYSFNFLSEHHYTPALLSYKFGFKGITLPVVTACSSSLVAIHNASKSLLLGESNIAIAGGVNTINHAVKGYLYEEGKIESKDGHCRAFDKESSGTSWGEGVGFVVLKRLKDALEDKDHIYCLIKGSASNNDANRRVGYTAPSVAGQSECIVKALKFSRVTPDSISYIEAHGTGTQLGDPIEVEALNKAYNLPQQGTIPIGAVKSNIGHLNFAAGIVGFIKAALCLKYKQVPPAVNFTAPNPKINFKNGPFYVNTRLSALERKKDYPYRVAVTSLGIGGTNAHVVLEEAPSVERKDIDNEGADVLTISAKTKYSLENNIARLLAFLESESTDLSSIAHTYRVSRSALDLRKSFTFSGKMDLINRLKNFHGSAEIGSATQDTSPVFVFSGQGSQYANMGAFLYKQSELFRKHMDAAFSLLKGITGEDFKEIVFSESEDPRIHQTFYTQPLIFSFQYAFVQLLLSTGIKPAYLLGHSLGEYTAACISGVFEFEEGLRIICERGRLIEQVPAGRMISVNVPQEKLDSLKEQLTGEIYISAENYTGNYVLAGLPESIEELCVVLKGMSIPYIVLPSQRAFHTPLLQEIKDAYLQFLSGFTFKKPAIPFVSCLTGELIEEAAALSPQYWVDQMLNTVRFEAGVERLLSGKETRLFIDIGPNNSNTKIIRNISRNQKLFTFFSKEKEYGHFLEVLGKLWEQGMELNWSGLMKKQQKMSVPTYAFDRYPFVTTVDINSFLTAGKHQKKKSYSYKETWRKREPAAVASAGAKYLVFSDDDNQTSFLLAGVAAGDYVKVIRGEQFVVDNTTISINGKAEEDYEKLFSYLKQKDYIPTHLLFVWSKAADETEEGIAYGYQSLYYIARAHSTFFYDKNTVLLLIGSGFYRRNEQEVLYPVKSTAVAAVKIITVEFQNIRGRIIDTDVFNPVLLNDVEEQEIMMREGQIFTKHLKQTKIKQAKNRLRDGKTYLVTGGYGGLGFEVSLYLATNYSSNLVLVGRSEEDISKRRLLEDSGGRVYYIKTDLADADALSDGIKMAEEQLGPISGVIHTSGVGDYNGIILRRSLAQDRQVFAPKIDGTQNLHSLLKHHQLDFFVGFSSRAVSKPFMGQLAYTAANSFLDSFLMANNGISIQWPTISEVGMAINALKVIPENEHKQILHTAIRPKRLVKVLCKAINGDSPLVIVSRHDINRQPVNVPLAASEEQTVLHHSRDQLTAANEYIAPVTDVEKKVIEIVAEILCFDKIGMKDNLYELGGDSLKAMVILNKIKISFEVDYSLRALLAANDIAAMVKGIESALQKSDTKEEVEEEKIVITI